jgi:Raf kinase inhibitor-like YbhB/YbcL family protein
VAERVACIFRRGRSDITFINSGGKVMNKALLVLASVLCTLCLSFTAHAFEVTSPAFEDGGELPKIYACSNQGGKDHSWEIDIHDVADGTVSLVVIMDDPDAKSVIGRTYVHWNVSNIPFDIEFLPSKRKGSIGMGKTGLNSSKKKSYQGMCPPNGEHTYTLAVYALNTDLKKRINRNVLEWNGMNKKHRIIAKVE